ASLFFYGWWNPLFLWLILLSITVNYAFAGHLMRAPGNGMLALAISFNLGLLGYFKYAGFLTQMLSDATGSGFQLGNWMKSSTIPTFPNEPTIPFSLNAWLL
ncbi:MAG: hypothetical protein COB10_07935, partial [Planctomycetota bacterium]